MKKTFVLILALCLALICAGGLAEETAPEAEEAPLTLHSVRYSFEHITLPIDYYDNPEQILTFFETHTLYELWERFTDMMGFDVTYMPEDFDQRWIERDDGMKLLLLQMPKPEETPLSWRIYLVQSAEGDVWYFTVESDRFVPDAAFLCMWTKDHIHYDYGPCAMTDISGADFEEKLQAEADMIVQVITEEPVPAGSFAP